MMFVVLFQVLFRRMLFRDTRFEVRVMHFLLESTFPIALARPVEVMPSVLVSLFSQTDVLYLYGAG